MDKQRIFYWISTGIMCAIFLFSACMYFSKYEMVSSFYGMLGFPIWMIYPLAGLKILGVVAILTRFSPLLKEWAYAGFFFLMSGAIFTHIAAADEAVEYFGPGLLLVLTIVSWYFRPADRKLING